MRLSTLVLIVVIGVAAIFAVPWRVQVGRDCEKELGWFAWSRGAEWVWIFGGCK